MKRKSMQKRINQSDIYMVDLFDSIDSEEKGIRPCICLSNKNLIDNSGNIIIAPITSSLRKKYMINHYELSKSYYGFLKYDKNIVLLENIRDLSSNRLQRFLGHIDEDDLYNIIELIKFDFIDNKEDALLWVQTK